MIAALAKQVGLTIYVPTSIPGDPAVTSASPFATPPLPGVISTADHYMIEFGNTLNVFITSGVAPPALPHGAPSEQSFLVPGAGNADAVVYQSAVSQVPPSTSYEVVLNVGHLSEGISSRALTEAQMLAIGKTLAAVAPGA